jgi:hypothetical protein
MARVVINAGMRKRATSEPFMRPITMPMPMMTRQDKIMPIVGLFGDILVRICVNTTEESAICDATERSNTPEVMANVIPIPQTANIAPCFIIVE